MKAVNILEGRHFSLDAVQVRQLVSQSDLVAEVLYFEAGQACPQESFPGSTLYQVLEGEVIIRQDNERIRAGTGRLVSVSPGLTHGVENAGGGLLALLRTRLA